MLSFKSNQNVQPLYDYYVETDLDSLDDQPVDYSKKYADQDSYEDCGRRKSVLKRTEFPSSEVSQTIKQSCNDEVKVYCIEGTPLTISSASSCYDLREVGTSGSVEKSDLKHSFPPVNDDENSDVFEVELKKNVDHPDSKKEESPFCKEKDDAKEVKSVSFRSGDDISKASSPLMFSRSSSVASLNSFEQQSIVDDRSSVSAFSALTSGLISPSDLPDSPGEVMSPALTDKGSSPKIDVTKADSDNELENTDLCEKDKIDAKKTVDNDSNNVTSSHLQLGKTKEYVPLDSYKSERNSEEEEDNEILAQQLELSNDSVEMDEVFSQSNYKDVSFSLQNDRDLSEQLSKSDDDSDVDDILLQQCIQLGMPNNSSEKKCDINACKKVEFQPHPQNVSNSQVEIKEDIVLFKKNALPNEKEDSPLHRELRTEEAFNKIDASITDICKANMQSQCLNYSVRNVELKNENPVNLDDDSDDDDDGLLQRCIQLGMPENSPNKIISGAEGFIKSRYSPLPINYSSGNDLYDQNLTKSDDDSDGDDILLQQCIQRGMPNKLPDNNVTSHAYKRLECPSGTKNSQVQHKNERVKSNEPLHYNVNNVMSQPCMQFRMPYKLNDKMGVSVKPVSRKMFPIKTDGESDGDENGILLQHCIQLGMPKESCEKKRLHPRIFRKSQYDAHSANYCAQSDLRDDCRPDGISDGDEEDDLLAKCIRAGMPSPKTASDVQSRLLSSQTASTSRKMQIPNRSFLPDTTIESNKKFSPSRLPQSQPYAPVHSSTTWLTSTSFIDVDSMRIYQTEDTPILSPSASISDLSSLSFNESFLNNSRNSDCTSDSDDDDELLQRCIRSGMPEAKRAVA